jgi:hypothetical protein
MIFCILPEPMTIPEPQLSSVKALCPDIDDEVIRDFLSRMDSEYLQQFQPAQMAAHISLAARLDAEHLSQVAVEPRADGSIDIAVVAYDYF